MERPITATNAPIMIRQWRLPNFMATLNITIAIKKEMVLIIFPFLE